MASLRLITWDADPLTEDEIRTVEKETGVLPADYRQFLFTSNGGRVLDELRFLLLEFKESNYLPVESFEVIEPRFPPPVLCPKIRGTARRLIRVAKSASAQFLLELARPQAGSIHHWDYELEERWKAEARRRPYLPTNDTLQHLAPSFGAFVEGLYAVPPEPSPGFADMAKTVENYAKYGDVCFAETERFFSKMSLAELNECWPKEEEEYGAQPIHYAANWSQPCTSKLLIDRGVDIHEAVRVCTNSFEITRIMIAAGATHEDLEELLLNASAGLAATSSPEENHKIILHLLELGIRPRFDDVAVVDAWKCAVDQIYGKKILRFLLRTFDFPASIQSLIRERLDRRPS